MPSKKHNLCKNCKHWTPQSPNADQEWDIDEDDERKDRKIGVNAAPCKLNKDPGGSERFGVVLTRRMTHRHNRPGGWRAPAPGVQNSVVVLFAPDFGCIRWEKK